MKIRNFPSLVILVDVDNSKGGTDADDLIAAATPIVESFGFIAA